MPDHEGEIHHAVMLSNGGKVHSVHLEPDTTPRGNVMMTYHRTAIYMGDPLDGYVPGRVYREVWATEWTANGPVWVKQFGHETRSPSEQALADGDEPASFDTYRELDKGKA